MQQISKHPSAQPYVDLMGKTASFFGPGDGQRALQLGKTLVEFGAVAVPLATLTAAGIQAAASKLTEASRKAQAYKSMMAENPHLHDRDAVLVQRYFNTLHRLNPELASDPTVAASFVNNMAAMNNPTMPHQSIWGEARQLSAQRRPDKGTDFGGQLDATLGRLNDTIKKDRTSELQGRINELQTEGSAVIRKEQMRNQVLKNYAKKMKSQAQNAGGYSYTP